jgi:hypothetical protein
MKLTKVLMPVPAARVSRGWISEGTSQPRGPLQHSTAQHDTARHAVLQLQAMTQQHTYDALLHLPMLI